MKKRTHWFVSAAIVAALFSYSCGSKPKSDTPAGGETTGESAGDSASTAAGEGTGTIKGTIKFTGEPIEMEEIDRSSDPFCAKTPHKTEYAIVNENKTLRNVGLRVLGAKGGDMNKETLVDQNECMYSPRVEQAINNKEITIKNSDATAHNVHAKDPKGKTLFNRSQGANAPDIKHAFDISKGDVVKLKCDIHPWMTGWVLLNENGFSTVTGDSGEFEIKDVPVGTYKLEAFHEHYGKKTQDVTVTKDGTVQVDFEYNGTETANYDYQVFTIGAEDGHHHH